MILLEGKGMKCGKCREVNENVNPEQIRITYEEGAIVQ